jgi:hypothetical protein
MAKLTLSDITGGYISSTTFNANNTLLEAALENTLSRDGTSPNAMSAVLDMNSYAINNLPDAVNNQSPVTLAQAASLASVTTSLSQENVGAVLYPRTAAEVSASVTPTNYYYEPGNVLRYGTNTNPGTTDMSDADGVINAYAPAGKYLIDTVYVPLGVTFRGDGAIETTARAATTFIQSGGVDPIRVKSLVAGSLWAWYGKMHDFAVYGDTAETVGFGINFKDSSGNNVYPQDTSIIRDITIRKMPQGGINIPGGCLPLSIGPIKCLFNNGPGITVSRGSGQIQSLNFLDVSGDGNNGGLIAINNHNSNDGSVTITNLKSEFRVNADYSSAEHQSNAIVCTTCPNMTLVINGATHISSVPDGGNFKKPGDFISLSGSTPKIMWSGIAIRVRGTDTGTDPKIIGGLGTVSETIYTDSCGIYNGVFKMFEAP